MSDLVRFKNSRWQRDVGPGDKGNPFTNHEFENPRWQDGGDFESQRAPYTLAIAQPMLRVERNESIL